MANNNNIFDDNYRRTFIKNADYKSLNSYLKTMEKLSKKGGKYKEIYDGDLDYILTLNDSYYQDGGDLIGLLTEKQSTDKRTMTEQPVCDTEGYLNRINNLTQNTYCSLTTQQTKTCDNRCVARLQELDKIKQVLVADKECIQTGSDWIKAIRKFIDIVLCCGETFARPENETFRVVYFKDLSKMITSNKKYLQEAFKYLGRILQNEKNKVSEEFMRKYSDMRLKKGTISKEQYNTLKQNLMREYITKLDPKGFEMVYSSKLVEKVLNAYKNMMTTTN
ncbi:hypothetical protein QKU48_gp0342 [Fadolivirus algeromassiliense]|jgi:hypothetical protein|uniref:Uncharacterized protein n=1 Tax=Fadolivirus FV1/VV64 TaxID=3070911 RepID=A0A7D3QWV0_9VIRU|nr:hypothetical protein QKU48_gp0342 [Fadolivirus algeromassiliense]QKF93800.1 hypothetical protein Fadolivirus_1_342 [Fadolivirus FV1/VV64]